jgi:hypothetical protein
MRSILKKYEKKFCIIENNTYALWGYLQKVNKNTIEFKTYDSKGIYIGTSFLPISEVKAVRVDSKSFEKFVCEVSFQTTLENESKEAEKENNNLDILSQLKNKVLFKWIPSSKQEDTNSK